MRAGISFEHWLTLTRQWDRRFVADDDAMAERRRQPRRPRPADHANFCAMGSSRPRTI
jgi:hypothetical protein